MRYVNEHGKTNIINKNHSNTPKHGCCVMGVSWFRCKLLCVCMSVCVCVCACASVGSVFFSEDE